MQTNWEHALESDPFKAFEILRNLESMVWSQTKRLWVVSRYDSICQLLKNNCLSTDRSMEVNKTASIFNENRDRFIEFGKAWPLFSSDHDHHMLRKCFSRAFEWKSPDERQLLRSLLLECLSSVTLSTRFDLVSELTETFPVNFIFEKFGIPKSFGKVFRTAASGLQNGLIEGSKDANSLTLEKLYNDIESAYPAYLQLVRENHHLASLCENLMQSALKDWSLSVSAGFSFFMNLIMASTLPLKYGLANILMTLFENVDVVPSAIKLAGMRAVIVEALRLEPPFLLTARIVSRNFTHERHAVSKGERILLLLGSANRDEHFFSNAQLFKPGQRDAIPLTFGHGAHECVGANWALDFLVICTEICCSIIPINQFSVEKATRKLTFGSRILTELVLVKK